MTRVGRGLLGNMSDSYHEGQMISEEGEEMEVDQEQVEFWNSNKTTVWLKAIGLTRDFVQDFLIMKVQIRNYRELTNFCVDFHPFKIKPTAMSVHHCIKYYQDL